MPNPRLLITAVVVEGRSQAEVARSYRVSQAWLSELVARYRSEGEAAFVPRSRRPASSPTATPAATVELIARLRTHLVEAGHDAGADTIAWHLQNRHGITVSRSTVWRQLRTAGLITPQPKKRPKTSYIRFAAEQPNELWQTDFTHWRLAADSPTGSDVEILTFLDDHSRLALHVSCHRPVTGAVVLACFADQRPPVHLYRRRRDRRRDRARRVRRSVATRRSSNCGAHTGPSSFRSWPSRPTCVGSSTRRT